MKFTPKNLIRNIHKLGPWSCYGLASSALEHYFPEEYKDGQCEIFRETQLVEKLGCKYWSDVIIKYHKEVGYKGTFNNKAVNEF